MDARWPVEVYHREVKQNSGIERCQASHELSAKKSYFSRYFCLV
ncbi:hypothetical protein [Candidatus Arsenophonus triatominarum]|nr:hypothetical protein [Candidatus Arsenophonus triatominarum]